MKKRTTRLLFWAFFIIGIAVGYLLPGDVGFLTKKVSEKPLQAGIFNVPKRLGQLDLQTDYFKYTVLAQAETGGIELIRLDESIPMHMHPKENHFLYVFKGRAKGTIGDVTAELVPGQLAAIPAGAPHSLERVGDTPLELILFSTPPFVPEDTIFLEKR